MHRTDLVLQQALDRQAALRGDAHAPQRRRRRGLVRRRIGAWIVRVGRHVAGERPASPAWQA
jgi:hypothetical protein